MTLKNFVVWVLFGVLIFVPWVIFSDYCAEMNAKKYFWPQLSDSLFVEVKSHYWDDFRCYIINDTMSLSAVDVCEDTSLVFHEVLRQGDVLIKRAGLPALDIVRGQDTLRCFELFYQEIHDPDSLRWWN